MRALRLALEFEEQKDFAKSLKIGKSTYSEVEGGARPVSLKLADKLRTKFNVPLEYTFYGDESQLAPRLRTRIAEVA